MYLLVVSTIVFLEISYINVMKSYSTDETESANII